MAGKQKHKYQWSESRRRYLQNGRAVPEKFVQKRFQAAIDSSKDKVAKLTQRLVDGKINVSAWNATMRDEIRAAHRAAAMLANGGRLTPQAAGRLGAALKKQYQFLDAFTRDIEQGKITLGPRTVARARLYAQAAMTTYQKAVLERERAAGAALYRLVLSPAEHCAECLADAEKGFVPVGSLPEIGDRECLINCKCRWEFK